MRLSVFERDHASEALGTIQTAPNREESERKNLRTTTNLWAENIALASNPSVGML